LSDWIAGILWRSGYFPLSFRIIAERRDFFLAAVFLWTIRLELA
jgi:hypothetical protein